MPWVHTLSRLALRVSTGPHTMLCAYTSRMRGCLLCRLLPMHCRSWINHSPGTSSLERRLFCPTLPSSRRTCEARNPVRSFSPRLGTETTFLFYGCGPEHNSCVTSLPKRALSFSPGATCALAMSCFFGPRARIDRKQPLVKVIVCSSCMLLGLSGVS